MNYKIETKKEMFDDSLLPILSPTACFTNQHSWIWASSSADMGYPPDDSECDCGRYRWGDVKDVEQ